MRLSVITLHAVKNYGSVLQTLATQEKLKEYVDEVEIIDYVKKENLDKNIVKLYTGKSKFLFRILKQIVMFPTLKKWNKVFNGFLKKYINLSEHQYIESDDFIKFPIKADIYCTGSDQVWNSVINKGIIEEFYLKFAPTNSKKISYSASFGVKNLDNSEKDRVRELLENYSDISVREESGIEILKDLALEKSTQILDPTLIMDAIFWRKYIHNRIIKKDYVLIYEVRHDKQLDKYATKFANTKGLKLVRVCIRYDQCILSGCPIFIPNVESLLSLFAHASYVITNSFHGTAFSINFNREFISAYPSLFGGRIENILNLTGLMDRHLKKYDDFTIANKQIDYTSVNRILDEEREKVDTFLKKAIGEPRQNVASTKISQ